MKRKNWKNVLAILSAAALSAQLALPEAFAEGVTPAAETAKTEFAESRGGRELKDDIIFIDDAAENSDKSTVKSISFGLPAGRGGKFDGEPPARPDNAGENSETPPARPDNAGEDSETPPEKPSDESEQRTDREPPEKPDGDTEQDFNVAERRRGMKPGKFGGGNDTDTNTSEDENSRPEPPEKPENDADFAKRIEISTGDTVSITKSDGTVLYTTAADKDAKGIVFASENLEDDETYTLLINGEAAATARVCKRGAGIKPGGPKFCGEDNTADFDSDRPPMPPMNGDNVGNTEKQS